MTENHKLCGVCDQNAVTKDSTHWCPECDQAFCTDCKNYHGLLKISKHHETILIDDHLALAEFFTLPEGHCKNHDERYQMYCPSHEELLCLQCIAKHADCNNIISIAKLAKGVMESEHFRSVEHGLDDAAHNTSKLEKHAQENIDSVVSQTSTLGDEITKFRKKINNHLDEIENRLRSDLSGIGTKMKSKFSTVLSDVNERKSAINNIRKKFDAIKEHGTEMQVFLCLSQLSATLSKEDQLIKLLTDSDILDRQKLKLDFNVELEKMFGIAMGSIQVESIPHNITLKSSELKQAQIIQTGPVGKDIDSLTAKHIITIETNTKGNITGCCVLPDGKIALSDTKKNVTIIQKDRQILYSVPLMHPYYPYDITCIDDRTVALSCYNEICLFDIIDRKMSKINATKCSEEVYGLTYREKLLICCINGKGIRLINPGDGSVYKSLRGNISYWSTVTLNKGNIIYTNRNTVSVECIKDSGESIWTFKDRSILEVPGGISTDNNGNIYVACKGKSNIVVLSPDGQKGRALLTAKDGIDKPCVLCFDKKNNRLIVSNNRKGIMFFDLG